MGKGVLPANDMPSGPPGPNVGMVCAIGDEESTETGHIGLLIGEEQLQLIHALQVEDDAPLLTIDLERVEVGTPFRKAGHLETPHGTIRKTG